MAELDDFQKFVKDEILPATKELEAMTSETSRKHLQKLVFTNLIDRFDVTVDMTILENYKDPTVLEKVQKSMTRPLTESDLVQVFIEADKSSEVIDEIVKESVRTSILNQRHSRKLAFLCSILQPEVNCWNQPRVNLSTGNILTSMKPQDKSVPYSICGYSDYLYSRRNAIVHGRGSAKILENDTKQLKTLFKVEPKTSFRISLSSIKITSTFYTDLAKLLTGQLTNGAKSSKKKVRKKTSKRKTARKSKS